MARFVIGPLESGYGVTLGNALRRVLLSSLEGAAITSIHGEGHSSRVFDGSACQGGYDLSAAQPEAGAVQVH